MNASLSLTSGEAKGDNLSGGRVMRFHAAYHIDRLRPVNMIGTLTSGYKGELYDISVSGAINLQHVAANTP
jgi:hypothetical protein